jgi:hypothetical protein
MLISATNSCAQNEIPSKITDFSVEQEEYIVQRACWMQQFGINILGVAQMQDIGIQLGNSMCKLCISHFMITEFTETIQHVTSNKKENKKSTVDSFIHPN